MDLCCRTLLTQEYRRWLMEHHGLPKPEMTIYLGWLLREHATAVVEEMERTNIALKVAQVRGFPNANALTFACGCGKPQHLIVVGSSLLLLMWRVLMIVLSLVIFFDNSDPYRWVWRFRPPESRDIYQLQLAIQMYLGTRDLGETGLDDLVGNVYAAPEFTAKYLTNIVSGAELFAVMHEKSHLLPQFNTFGPERIRLSPEFGISDRRGRLWQREIAADLSGAQSLLNAKYNRLMNELPEPDARQAAVHWTVTSCSAAFDVMALVEHFSGADVDRCATSLDFARHPPVRVRFTSFEDWMNRRLRSGLGVSPDTLWGHTQMIHSLIGTLIDYYEDTKGTTPGEQEGEPT